MKAYSQYYIKGQDSTVLIVNDENPEGVTITIKNNSVGAITSFNLPRYEMIEALEYIINKIKTTL